ncbi:MAG: tetratricopeptide repeat protein [Myxococcota bacterium]|nr:tetratricopeptide repeat protein [Myxococcota bacterium]
MTEEIQNARAQLAANPDDAEAWERLVGLLLDTSDFDGLIKVFSERANGLDATDARASWKSAVQHLHDRFLLAEDLGARSEIALTIGRVIDAHLDSPEQAMGQYQAAYRLDPENAAALDAARDLAVRRTSWAQAFQLAALEVRLNIEPARKTQLHLFMARLCEEHLDRPSGAYRWAAKVLEADAGNADAQALHERLGTTGRHKEARYLALMEDVRGIRDRRKRSATMIERASVWFDESPDDPWVEEALWMVLNQDPRNTTARTLLDEFYEANQRWLELSRYLADRVKNTPRKSDRLSLYQRLAELAHFNLRDAEQAVVWHREVLRLNPLEKASLQYCVDHFSSREDWRGLVGVYEAALRTRQRGGDEAAMLIQIAMILWKKLDDHRGAESYFRRIKLNQPKHPLMLQFYVEYFDAQGDYRRLLNVLSAQLASSDKDEIKLTLGKRMAEVAEAHLKNPEKAIDIWKGVVKVAPDDVEAREALKRLYRAASKWNALLEFLKEDLAEVGSQDPDGAIAILTEMVEVYRDRLKLPVMVANVYHQLLELDPTNLEALDALEARYRSANRWTDLIEILERRCERHRQDDKVDQFVELSQEMATIWQTRFSNLARAAECLEAILEVRPEDKETLSALTELYRSGNDWPALVETLRRLAPVVDVSERRGVLLDWATIAQTRLDQPEDAIDAYREVLSLNPTDVEVQAAYEGALESAEHWIMLADFYDEQLSALEGQARLPWLAKLAIVSQDKLEQLDRAVLAWNEIIEADTEHQVAESRLTDIFSELGDWHALEDLYGQRGRWSHLVPILSSRADACVDLVEKGALLEQIARICGEELGDRSAETACWAKIFSENAHHPSAAQWLITRYTEDENWTALAEALEAHIAADSHGSLGAILQLAGIHDDKLNAPQDAFEWYAQALRLEPDRLDILESLSGVAARSNRGDELLSLLEMLLGTVGEARAAYLRRAAQLVTVHRADEMQAAQYYTELLDMDAADMEVLGALGHIYEGLEKWEDLLSVYEQRLAAVRGTQEEIEVLGLIGHLYVGALDAPGLAMETFEQMLGLEPGHRTALAGLQALSELAEDWAGLNDYLVAELETVDGDDARAHELRIRLGQLMVRLEDWNRAVEHFAAALLLAPGDGRAEDALMSLMDETGGMAACEALRPYLAARGDYERLDAVLLQQAELEPTIDDRVAHLFALARLRRDDTKDQAGALEVFLRALAIAPLDDGVLDEVELSAHSLDDWRMVVVAYRERSFDGTYFSGDADEAMLVGRRLARALEQELEDLDGARTVMATLLDEGGDDVPSLVEYGRLVVALEDWPEKAQVIERLLIIMDEQADRLEQYRVLATLYLEQLQDPQAALGVFRRWLEDAPDSGEAAIGLEDTLKSLDDHRALADFFEDRLEDESGEERAQTLLRLSQLLAFSLGEPLEAMGRLAERLAAQHDDEIAIEMMEEIIAESADHADAADVRAKGMSVLMPIYLEAGDWQGQIRLHQWALDDESDLATRVDHREKIAALYENEGNDPQLALEMYAAALTQDGLTTSALDNFLRLVETTAEWERLADVVEALLDGQLLNHAEDDLSLVLAERAARIFGGPAQRLEDAQVCNEYILQQNPENHDALVRLDALFTAAGDNEALARILADRLALADDLDDRLPLTLRLGDLFERALGQLPEAAAVYASIQADVPAEDGRVHDALARLYTMTENWHALVGVLVDQAERSTDAPEKIELLLKAAETYEGMLDEPEQAVVLYEEILELDDTHIEVLQRLDRLYETAGRAVDLLDILSRELASASRDDDRVRLELRRASLLVNEMEDEAAAVVAYQNVLKIDAHHEVARAGLRAMAEGADVRPSIVATLRPLYEVDGDWQSVVDLLALDVDDTDVIDDAVARSMELAELKEQRLADANGAFELVAQAYRMSDGDEEVGLELERLALGLERYGELVELWSHIASFGDERETALRLRVAQIAESHLNDVERAIDEYREVLELDSRNEHAFDALEQLLSRLHKYEALVELLEQRVGLADDGGERRGFALRIATLYEEALDDTDEAIQTWRRILSENEVDFEAMANLERLLERALRWDEYVAQVEYRLHRLDDDDDRNSAHLVIGQVSLQHLDDGQKAVDAFKAVLAKAPQDFDAKMGLQAIFEDEELAVRVGLEPIDVVPALESIYRAEEDHERLRAVLTAKQTRFDEHSEEKKDALKEIAELSRILFGDGEQTFEGYVQLFEEDASQGIRDELIRLARLTGRLDELTDILSRRMSECDESELAVELGISLAGLYRFDLNDDVRALAVYEDILDYHPQQDEAFSGVVDLLTAEGDWKRLSGFYRSQSDAVDDVGFQRACLVKAAQILEDRLQSPDEAIELWQSIRSLDTGNDGVLALERLFAEQDRWADLSSLLEEQIEECDQGAKRADLRVRLAEIQQDGLGDVIQAVESLRIAIIEDQSDYEPAVKRLETILLELGSQDMMDVRRLQVAEILRDVYERLERWADWTDMLEVQIEFAGDAWARLEILDRMARNQETKEGDSEIALYTWARALKERFGLGESYEELGRLASQLGRWDVFASALEDGVDEFENVDEAGQLLIRLAEVYEAHLDDLDGAIDAYGRALERDRGQAEVCENLIRLLDSTGQNERLVDVLHHKVELLDDTAARRDSYLRIAAIRETQLNDSAGAIDALRQAFDEDPYDLSTLDALIRLQLELARWEDAANSLRDKLELLEDEAEQRAVYAQLATLMEGRLENTEEAISSLQAALDVAPDDEAILKRLCGLYEREGDWDALMSLLEQQQEIAVEQRGHRDDSIDVRIAKILLDHVQDAQQAIERLAEILERSPEHDSTIALLEDLLSEEGLRHSVCQVLESHYATRSQTDLARIIEAQVTVTEDEYERIKLLKRLGGIQQDGLNRMEEAFQTFSLAFELDPTDLDVRARLEATAESGHLLDRLAELYLDAVEEGAEPNLGLELNEKLGRLFEGRLNEPSQAITAWQRILQTDPSNDDALVSLDGLYSRSQSWPELVHIVRMRIDAGHDADATLLCRLGRLVEVTEQNVDEAVRLHIAALAANPALTESRTELERLVGYAEHRQMIAETLRPIYADAGDWARWIRLNEFEMEVLGTPADRAEQWLASANVRLTELGTRPEAFENLIMALEEVPDHTTVRSTLIELGQELQAWDQMADAFEVAAASVSSDLAIEDHMMIARWCLEHLEQPDRSVSHYRQVLAINESHDGALAALDDLFTRGESLPELADIKLLRAQHEYDLPVKRAFLHEAGALFAGALDEPEQAVTVFEECIELDEEDAVAIEALDGLYESLGRWGALIDLLEQRVDTTYDDQVVVELLSRIGWLAQQELADLERATAAYERILEIDGASKAALSALALLYEEQANWFSLQDLLIRELADAQEDMVRLDLLTRLAGLCVEKLDQPEAGIDFLRQAHELDPSDAETTQLLVESLRGSERWFDLVETLEAYVQTFVDAGETTPIDVLIQLGSICVEHLGDTDKAITYLRQALDLDGESVEALSGLGELYQANSEWDKAVDILDQALGLAEGPMRGALLRQLGLLHRDHLNDSERARDYLELAIEESSDLEAIDAMLQESDIDDQLRVELLERRVAQDDSEARLEHLTALGQLKKSIGDYAGAILALDECLEAEPESVDLTQALAELYQLDGRIDDARDMLRSLAVVLERERRHASLEACLFSLGCLAEDAGEHAEAANHFRRCFELDASHLPMLLRYGRLLVHHEDWAQGLRVLQAALLQQAKLDDGERADLFFNLGCVRRETGDTRKARDMFNRVLLIEETHQDAKAAIEQLST